MADALIVAHCRRACLLQSHDQAAQVGGIAPSSPDRCAKSGDARNPPINRPHVNVEVESQINTRSASFDEPFCYLAIFRLVRGGLARAATKQSHIHCRRVPLWSTRWMATTKPPQCEQPSASITCHDGNFQVEEHLDIFARAIYVPGGKDWRKVLFEVRPLPQATARRDANVRATCCLRHQW